jgi:hypothetical protein
MAPSSRLLNNKKKNMAVVCQLPKEAKLTLQGAAPLQVAIISPIADFKRKRALSQYPTENQFLPLVKNKVIPQLKKFGYQPQLYPNLLKNNRSSLDKELIEKIKAECNLQNIDYVFIISLNYIGLFQKFSTNQQTLASIVPVESRKVHAAIDASIYDTKNNELLWATPNYYLNEMTLLNYQEDDTQIQTLKTILDEAVNTSGEILIETMDQLNQ